MVAVRANLAAGLRPGRPASRRCSAAAEELGLPPGYRHARARPRPRAGAHARTTSCWTFVLSFVFMYIVLAAQYEHLVHPLTILLSLPLAVPFGLLSLWLGRRDAQPLLGPGHPGAVRRGQEGVDPAGRPHQPAARARAWTAHEAILQANRDRLRPILMTTIAFVAGMLPLLIATGPGAEERRSIAVLAVGGQTLSLLLTLLAMPVIYSLLDDLTRLVRPAARTQDDRIGNATDREPVYEAEALHRV